MTETEYVPPTEVPDLAELIKQMKEDAKKHPEYGTCPNCIKAVRVDKFGHLREHNTPELVRGGSMKATYQCPGSHQPYAEHGDFGQYWDLKNGSFQDVPVDALVLLVAHDAAGAVDLPVWQIADVPATELSRAAGKKLFEATKWRIDLTFSGRFVTGHLIRIDQGDGHLIVWESQTEGQAFGGIMSVVSQLMSRLEATELNDRMAARK